MGGGRRGLKVELVGRGLPEVEQAKTEPVSTHVIEFYSRAGYHRWLLNRHGQVRILSVATTKRWGFGLGFLGDAKTFTVTYEGQPPARGEQQDAPAGAVLLLLVIAAIAFVVFILNLGNQP